MPFIKKVVCNLLSLKPRIIIPKHPSRRLVKISFVPIKGNQILLVAAYSINSGGCYLHLSIHEIRSDTRVGPALWSFSNGVDRCSDISHLELIRSENPLGITFGRRFDDHWKLFDISTTDPDASDNFPLIESGRMDFDLKLKSQWGPNDSLGLFEILMQSC